MDASDDVHQYTIWDGIHRILALKEMGYAYVLAEVPSVKVHQQPSLPPEATLHYKELERIALLFAATEILGTQYLDAPKLNENVYLVSLKKNVISFSILRHDRDVGNVEDFPPDCTVVVLSVDVNDISVTATIFSQEFQYRGIYQEVSRHILNECCVHLGLNHTQI